MTDVNDSFRYCMQIYAHLCTSVSSCMAEPLQAEPLPADAVPEQALEERQPEEARHGEGILGILYTQELFGWAYALYMICSNEVITTVRPRNNK